MTIVDAFIAYLENSGVATFGQDLFASEAPSSNNVTDSIWWVIASGGSPVRNTTGESIKTYQVDVFYRSRDYLTVYNSLYALEEQLNCSGCVELEGFEVIEISATSFPIDNDLDNEDRKVGLVQVTITTHKEC